MSILCVGQIVFDILASPIDNRIFDYDTTLADTIVFSNGGDAQNVATVCRKLGREVGFCGKIGEDDKGRFLLERLKSTGLDMEGLKIDRNSMTSAVIVLIQKDGARNFIYQGASNDEFSIDDVDLSILDRFNLIFVGGTFMLPSFDGHGAAKLFKEAKKSGKTTAMDVSWDSSGKWMEIIEPCLQYLDFFIPSYGEAKEIAKTEDVKEMAGIFLSQGVGHVIIKMGENGVFIKDADNEIMLPSFKVDVVDTTGAGDSFVAGFLSGLDIGLNIMEAADLGQATAAQCVRHIGSTTGITDLEQIKLELNKMERR